MHEFWSYTIATVFVLIMTLSTIFIYASCGIFQFIFSFQMSAYLKILQHRLETKGAADKSIYEHHKTVNQ
ncbi:hypothetical protein O3M35_009778 [Rhynocoris fuscipes]|uniref:Uncharacterized protein n=1 Tax=Rhynocoris fuscipes TaxID=488301 RepID=A0AAW1DB68_9HEMI